MISYNGLIKLGFSTDDFKLQDDSDGNGVYIKEWLSASPLPSVAEIEAAEVEWQTEYDSLQYARDRASAYPSLADQADMQYWDAVNGTTTWQDAIAKVKADYPKG